MLGVSSQKGGKAVERQLSPVGFTDKQFEWVAEETTPSSSSETSPGSHVDLHFVSETGVARPKGPFRDLIRSKARKKARYRNIPSKQAELRSSLDACRAELGREDSPQHDQKPSMNRHASSPSSADKRSLEIRTLEPSYPFVSNSGRGKYYIHLYLNAFKHTYPHAGLGGLKKKQAVLGLAVEEPALMHATMSHTALGVASLSLEQSQSSYDKFCHDQFYHKGEAIRLVNQRIGSIVNGGVAGDGLIAAVTCLMHFEIRSESRECIREHMNGLELLVNSRGGLQSIYDQGEASRIVSWFTAWTDYCTAISLNEPLRFPPLIEKSSSQPHLNTLDLYNFFTTRLHNNLTMITGLSALAEQGTYLYWHLKHLAPIRPMEASRLMNTGQSATLLEYKSRLVALERRAVLLSQSKLRYPNAPDANLAIYKLLGSAALIQILLFLRDSPCSVPLCHILSSRMKEELEDAAASGREKLQAQFPEVMIWVILMGGMGSIGNAVTFDFFVRAFVSLELNDNHDARGWDEAESALKEFMWFDVWEGPDAMVFWSQVAREQELGQGQGLLGDSSE